MKEALQIGPKEYKQGGWLFPKWILGNPLISLLKETTQQIAFKDSSVS
jgi:hypothetical protein